MTEQNKFIHEQFFNDTTKMESDLFCAGVRVDKTGDRVDKTGDRVDKTGDRANYSSGLPDGRYRVVIGQLWRVLPGLSPKIVSR